MPEQADHKIQPIIIKRINKIAAAHHGGAWKVAYADFVTAMMAFFLLLWLLATTTPEQRDGIAEYFTPTVGLKDSKGIGFEGGLTPQEKGPSRTTMAPPGLVAGQVPQGPRPKPPEDTEAKTEDEQSAASTTLLPQAAKSETSQESTKSKEEQARDEKEQEALKKVQEQLQRTLEENSELQQLRKNIIITNTPEGLKIEVIDDPEKPIFVEGTATMTDTGRLMFKTLGNVVSKTRNQLSITGHTEHISYPAGSTYTSWELSSDRANATRRFMTESLRETRRVAKVVGMADRELLLPKEPQSPRNRRISLVLLRGSQMVDMQDAPPGRDLLSVPEVDAGKIVHKKPEPPTPPKKPVEIPETRPGSIFHQKSAPKEGAAKESKEDTDESRSGLGFNVPDSVRLVPSILQKVEKAPPPPPPAKPIEVPETNPDSIFTAKKPAGTAAPAPGFTVPDNVPPAPPAAPKDETPPPSEPIQLPATAPDSLFAPDTQDKQGFKAPN